MAFDIQVFDSILKDLHNASYEIEASALMSADGIMLASHLPKETSDDKMAAMSAAMLSLSDRMVGDLSGGETDRVMIQSSVGYVIVTAVSAEILLTVVAQPDAKLGMVFHDIKNAQRQVQSLDFATA